MSQDAWARTFIEAIRVGLAVAPKPPRPRTLFDSRFAYVRDPRSGSENEKLDALKAAGYGMVALNVGDHAPTEWAVWRSAASARGIHVIPWARTHTAAQIATLVGAATGWQSPGLIVNLEQELTEPRWLMTGPDVRAALSAFPGQVGVSTEPFMPGNFDWLPLIELGAVDLPQSAVLEFPQYPPALVVDRAEVFGWTSPVPSFGTYDVNGKAPKRSDYAWTGNFGIYTVDDLAVSEIGAWK